MSRLDRYPELQNDVAFFPIIPILIKTWTLLVVWSMMTKVEVFNFGKYKGIIGFRRCCVIPVIIVGY